MAWRPLTLLEAPKVSADGLPAFRLLQDGLRTVRVLLPGVLIGGVPVPQGEKNTC